jgi:cysteine synthase A
MPRFTRAPPRAIINDFADQRLDYFVTGFGTGGTLYAGQSNCSARDLARIVAAEPDNAQVLGSGIPQPRDTNGAATSSHPLFRPHLMQGWAPDFISRLTENAVNEKLIDEIVPVAGGDAIRLSRELAQREGIFVGTSSGGTLAAALKIAERAPAGPYLQAAGHGRAISLDAAVRGIGEEMTAEEWEVSRRRRCADSMRRRCARASSCGRGESGGRFCRGALRPKCSEKNPS